MDLINRESLIDKLDPLYKKKKETAPDNLAEGFMQVGGLIGREPSAFEGMTNGDVIISLYPDLKYTIQNGRVVTTIGVASSFDLDWWNAPYQKGGE